MSKSEAYGKIVQNDRREWKDSNLRSRNRGLDIRVAALAKISNGPLVKVFLSGFVTFSFAHQNVLVPRWGVLLPGDTIIITLI
jgi:hypothetical protein